jgi:hypothetical protein
VRSGLTKKIAPYNPVSIGYREFGDIVRYVLGRSGWRPVRLNDRG